MSGSSVCLDSSEWIRLSRDYYGNKNKESAQSYIETASSKEVVHVLCIHHIYELSPNNRNIVLDRYSMFKKFDRFMFIKSSEVQGAMGGVTDIFKAEVLALRNENTLTPEGVVDCVKRNLFDERSGLYIANDLSNGVDRLIAASKLKNIEDKVHVAITELLPDDFASMTIREAIKSAEGRAGFDKRIVAARVLQNQKLIAERGDKKIDDPGAVARWHMQQALAMYPMLQGPFNNPLKNYFLANGIGEREFDKEKTMKNVQDYIQFFDQLKAVLPWHIAQDIVRKVDRSQVPSWIIQKSIRDFRQKEKEHKGGNLNDRHLATMSPYCDVMIVDSRTRHIFDCAKPKISDLSGLTLSVKQVGTYSNVLGELNRNANFNL